MFDPEKKYQTKMQLIKFSYRHCAGILKQIAVPILLSGLYCLAVFLMIILPSIALQTVDLTQYAATASLLIAGLFVLCYLIILVGLTYFFAVMVQKAWNYLTGESSEESLWKAARGRILPLAGGKLIFDVVIIALQSLLPALLPAAGLTSILFSIVALYLSIRVLFWPIAIVVEKKSMIEGLKRTWQLSRSSFWRILLVDLGAMIPLLLLLLILVLLSSTLSPILAVIVVFAGSFLMVSLHLSVSLTLYHDRKL